MTLLQEPPVGLREELARHRALLELIEWGSYCETVGDKCPCCQERPRDGHAFDCELARLLGRPAETPRPAPE